MKRLVFVSLVLALLVVMQVGASSFINTANPNVLYEDFETGQLKKPDLSEPWDYWYVTLISADALGFFKQENLQSSIHCNNAACLTVEDENDTHFARLALYPQQYPGVVNISQFSEQRDAFAYGLPHRWSPTPGHPVVLETRMRMSPNFHADGSGGALGTLLMQLWNAPDDYHDPSVDITRDNSGFYTHTENLFTMGFTWLDQNTAGGFLRGFKAVVSDHAFGAPTYLADLSFVNINDWFVAKIIWATDSSGAQTVTFYINGQQVGFTPLAVPMPSLEFLAIADSNEVQFGPNGPYFIPTNPTAPQLWDIDYVGVSQS